MMCTLLQGYTDLVNSEQRKWIFRIAQLYIYLKVLVKIVTKGAWNKLKVMYNPGIDIRGFIFMFKLSAI